MNKSSTRGPQSHVKPIPTVVTPEQLTLCKQTLTKAIAGTSGPTLSVCVALRDQWIQNWPHLVKVWAEANERYAQVNHEDQI